MSYRARQKRKQSNKVVIGIIIAICIVISICLLSLINIPIISSLSSKILYGVDATISSVSGLITQGVSYFGNTKKLNEKIAVLEKMSLGFDEDIS